MAIVDDLNRVRDWLQAEVCEKVRFKLPNDNVNDAGYNHELVTPSAFVLYTPSKDRLPPDIRAPFPSVCVRLSEGEHTHEGLHIMRLVLNFATWNPGIHGRDVFTPMEEGTGGEGYDQENKASYQRAADGWMDVYNFIDVTLREIENAGNIGGMRVRSEDGIKYGMAREQNAVEDYYPFWAAWLTFSLQGGNVRSQNIDEYL